MPIPVVSVTPAKAIIEPGASCVFTAQALSTTVGERVGRGWRGRGRGRAGRARRCGRRCQPRARCASRPTG